jgi:hypothetical protein
MPEIRIDLVKETYLKAFLTQIEPFRELWRSVRFVCYAGKLGSAWVLLGGQMQLSPKALPAQLLSKEADFDTFFAFVNEFSSQSLESVLYDIVQTENIHLNLGGGPFFKDIRLSAETQNNQSSLSWFNPVKFDRRGFNFFDTYPVGFSLGVQEQRQFGVIPGGADCWEKANEQLRRETHFDGVEALVRKLTPSLKVNTLSCPQLQLVAPLPFDLVDMRNGGVKATIPVTAQGKQVTLKMFFYPEPQQPAVRPIIPTEYSEEGSSVHIKWNPEWPGGATNAIAHLFWDGRSIDAVPINRWKESVSILGVVDEYFDPERKRLRGDLAYREKRPQEEFEQAVVRLLNVLGLPTIWYGKTVGDRADAFSIIQSDKTTLLLIECTREKPIEKFSTLAERANHLRKSLPVGAEVLPVVFTAARTVMSEAEAAVEHGLGLIGADDIDHLLGLISTPGTTPTSVLDYIRPRETIEDQILRTTGELSGL